MARDAKFIGYTRAGSRIGVPSMVTCKIASRAPSFPVRNDAFCLDEGPPHVSNSPRTPMRSCLVLLSTLVLLLHPASAQETIFSGPQPNEKLPELKVRGILDELAGKELDFVEQANGNPLLLIFIHDVNRQSIGFVRTLTRYSMSRSKDGLNTGVVMLADDASQPKRP